MGKRTPKAGRKHASKSDYANVVDAVNYAAGPANAAVHGLGQYLPPSYPPPRELSLAEVRDRAEMAVLRAITDLMVWNPGGDAERNARLNVLIGALCAVRS